MELTEQANELGFESLGEAEQAGYGVDWKNARLIKIEDEQEQAHKDYLKRKEEILGELISVYNDIDVPKDCKTYLKHAIDFIKEGEI
jgi:predicted transcriptional regulator